MSKKTPQPPKKQADLKAKSTKNQQAAAPQRPQEIGGRKGPEPTRFGDWELNGKCVDF